MFYRMGNRCSTTTDALQSVERDREKEEREKERERTKGRETEKK